jgi:hypothetical protein
MITIGTFRKIWEMIGGSLLWSKSAQGVRQVGGSGIYCGIPPSGTIAANGVYTTPTALLALVTTSVPGTWCYLPAGALASGAAGLYWFAWTSTTTATVYAPAVPINTATGFDAYLPDIAQMTLAVGSGTAFSQPISTNIAVSTHKIPGGFLGKRGTLMTEFNAVSSSSAGTKSATVRLNNTTISSAALTTNVYFASKLVSVRNMGVTNIQQSFGNNAVGSANNTPPAVIAIDTLNDFYSQFCVQIPATTDWAFICGNVLALPKD